MSLPEKLGVARKDLIEVIPVASQDDPRGKNWGKVWAPLLDPPELRVFSRKIGAGEAYRDGKTETRVNFTVYADHRRTVPFPLNERHRLWHPELSKRNSDDTPNYATALEIQSVVTNNQDGVAIIDCGGAL